MTTIARYAFSYLLLLTATAIVQTSSASAAMVIFSDDFNTSASPLWGNEYGNWSATNGEYQSGFNDNNPLTYSSLPYDLTDFSVEVTVRGVGDGGIWLRSSDNGNGIVLVTGGAGWGSGDFVPAGSGNSLYWHILQNGSFIPSPAVIINPVEGVFVPNNDYLLRVDVAGDTYSAYVNDVLITTLVDSTYASGKVGLYDFYGPQRFDSVQVSIPEANVLLLCGIAGAGMIAWRRR